MSIQDWSTTDSITSTSKEETSRDEDNSVEIDLIENLPESEIQDTANLLRNKPVRRNLQENSPEKSLEKPERLTELGDTEISFIETESSKISLLETESFKKQTL